MEYLDESNTLSTQKDRMFKKLLLLAIPCVVVLVIVLIIGIVPTKGKVDGKWKGKYYYNGNTFSNTIVLNSGDMSYSEITYKNGELYKCVTDGNWRISGTKIELENEESLVPFGACTVYRYSFGRIKNGSHYLKK